MTSLLKGEPPEAVRSLEELFAIAFALEQEAATWYRALAERMREHGTTEVAAVFERLAEAERGHLDKVARWSKRQMGKTPDTAGIRWRLPETLDHESAREMAASRLMTPYRALSMVVRNGERAFAFWSYVTAQAREPQIRQAAETMAREELERVSMLRRERRRAYHVERGPRREGVVSRPRSLAESLVEAADLERSLADQLADLAAEPKQEISNERLRQLAEESHQIAEELCVSRAPLMHRRYLDKTADAQKILATAELLVDRYLDLADHAKDEATIGRAQSLAQRAIDRLAWLNSVITPKHNRA